MALRIQARPKEGSLELSLPQEVKRALWNSKVAECRPRFSAKGSRRASTEQQEP